MIRSDGGAIVVPEEIKLSKSETCFIDPAFKLSDQSIQTFFYTAIRNHVDLAKNADKKANTLLGVSVLLLSVLLLGVIVNWAKMNSGLAIVATIILVCSNIITILLSVFSTRPIMQKARPNREESLEDNVNLAFFQNFTHLEYADFSLAVNNMKRDKTKIISVLTKDLYFLGKSLNSKYNWVNWAYNIFLIGLTLSFVLFIINLKCNP